LFNKIKSVTPLQKCRLEVTFETNEKKQYDVALHWAKIAAFSPILTNDTLFKQVRVEPGGYGIAWTDEIDLSCNELYNNGGTL